MFQSLTKVSLESSAATATEETVKNGVLPEVFLWNHQFLFCLYPPFLPSQKSAPLVTKRFKEIILN